MVLVEIIQLLVFFTVWKSWHFWVFRAMKKLRTIFIVLVILACVSISECRTEDIQCGIECQHCEKVLKKQDEIESKKIIGITDNVCNLKETEALEEQESEGQRNLEWKTNERTCQEDTKTSYHYSLNRKFCNVPDIKCPGTWHLPHPLDASPAPSTPTHPPCILSPSARASHTRDTEDAPSVNDQDPNSKKVHKQGKTTSFRKIWKHIPGAFRKLIKQATPCFHRAEGC